MVDEDQVAQVPTTSTSTTSTASVPATAKHEVLNVESRTESVGNLLRMLTKKKKKKPKTDSTAASEVAHIDAGDKVSLGDTPLASPLLVPASAHPHRTQASEVNNNGHGYGGEVVLDAGDVGGSDYIVRNNSGNDLESERHQEQQHQHLSSGGSGGGLLRKMTRKFTKTNVFKVNSKGENDSTSGGVSSAHPHYTSSHSPLTSPITLKVIDLTHDDSGDCCYRPTTRKMSLSHMTGALEDKTEVSSQQSQQQQLPSAQAGGGGTGGGGAAAATSAGGEKEGVQFLLFSSSVYLEKGNNNEKIDAAISNSNYSSGGRDLTEDVCLWVGTTFGSLLCITIHIAQGLQRQTHPSTAAPNGTIFRIKGTVMCLSIFDQLGRILSESGEATSQEYGAQMSEPEVTSTITSTATASSSSGASPQAQIFAVICSERQAKALHMPSFSSAHKHSVKFSDSSKALVAKTIYFRNSVCLSCLTINGDLLVYSLPRLRPLLSYNLMSNLDIRSLKTFQFGHLGQVLYFCSPSEIQRTVFSKSLYEEIVEYRGDCFTPGRELPLPISKGFFSIFFDSPTQLDREELFGTKSGKAMRTVATVTQGSGGEKIQKLAAQSGSIADDVQRTKQALHERGEKLGQLEDRSAAMADQSRMFYENCAKLSQMHQQKDRKWWSLF